MHAGSEAARGQASGAVTPGDSEILRAPHAVAPAADTGAVGVVGIGRGVVEGAAAKGRQRRPGIAVVLGYEQTTRLRGGDPVAGIAAGLLEVRDYEAAGAGERTPGPYGKGNGWVVMSIADTMEMPERNHPSCGPLESVLEKMLGDFAVTQNPSGLWHTVLDAPASYAECSATSMVVYGVLKLVRLGVVRGAPRVMAMRA